MGTASNDDKVGLEGKWGTAHTSIGLDVDSHRLTPHLPEAQIAGARILREQFSQL